MVEICLVLAQLQPDHRKLRVSDQKNRIQKLQKKIMRTCFKFPYSSLKRDWEDEGRVDEVLLMVDVALYHSNFNGNCIQIRVNRYGFGWQGMKGISVGESVQAIIPLSIPARATTSSST